MEEVETNTPENFDFSDAEPKKWYTPVTTVTTFSKMVALALFVALPFIGFYIGYTFKSATVETVTIIKEVPAEEPREVVDETPDTGGDSGGMEVPTPGPGSDPVACTMEAKMCPDGSFVGRVGPDCEFEACPSEVVTDPPETPGIECTPESRMAEACDDVYMPVCASVQVECITTPCPPVKETKSNSCYACANDRVISYTEGACAGDE